MEGNLSIAQDGQEITGEDLFRRLLEAAPDALILVNESGQILLANTQAEKVFGYVKAELLGKSVEVLVPTKFHAKHSEHRAHYHAAPTFRPMGILNDLYASRKDGSTTRSRSASVPGRTMGGHW